MKKITAVILAAGKGERMKSELPKVLHLVDGKPLVSNVIATLEKISCVAQIIVVTGYEAKLVESSIKKNHKRKPCFFVRQTKLLGTADAIACALPKVKHPDVLVLCGDAPLIREETIQAFIAQHEKQKTYFSILTAYMDAQNDLGKIVRDPLGNIQSIKEKSEIHDLAGISQEKLREVNSGMYIFDRQRLVENLPKIQKNANKGEYYLTDIVSIFYDQGGDTTSMVLKDNNEIIGINTRQDLALANKIARIRTLDALIDQGVTIMDKETTYIDSSVKIGKNCVIFPFTFIENDVIIGDHCSLGPFLHLRQGTRIKAKCELGNFVEVVRSTVGNDVRMKHHTYMGDCTVEDHVNIGAGTIIANYDGKHKHKTLIGKNAFIGSDTVLVAPVTIGQGAMTGAGSVVTKNVAAKSTVVGVPAKILKKRT